MARFYLFIYFCAFSIGPTRSAVAFPLHLIIKHPAAFLPTYMYTYTLQQGQLGMLSTYEFFGNVLWIIVSHV